MEHTKGEWKYTEELRANMSMISGDDTVVCGLPNPVDTGYEEGKEAELLEMRANANLIAAAPDMYEALKGITAQFERVDKLYSKDREYIQKANEALAKVEGGS